LTTYNMANLVVQAASICVLAMGLVFVLLLGEIDLSAGVAGGASATITALAIVDHGWPWWAATLAGLAVGAVIGLVIGLLVSLLGIPSFVVTLALFLALQALPLRLIGSGGSIRFNDEVLRGMSIKNVPVTAGWIAAAVIVVGYAGLSLWKHRSRVTKGLAHKPLALVLVQIAVLAGIVLGVTALLSANRAPNPLLFNISGVPWVAPVVIALLLFWTFMLTRTRFGRHLYAVGGNAEAARRAGINVKRIKVTAFVICSGMAAIAGILSASFTGKVSPGSGGGNELLYAVGAAVIGGTSLFGGRGRAIDAVVGGLVIATIPNGLGLLDQASYINFLVTGGVLLVAASVDAISRRRRSAAGV
jgi:D-xylose transport system permease protein